MNLDLEDEILAVTTAIYHYKKILATTDLLIQYATVFETGSLLDSIRSIVRWIDVLEENLTELVMQKSKEKVEEKK